MRGGASLMASGAGRISGPVKLDGCPELTELEKALARVCSDPGQWVRRRYWPDGYPGDGVEYEILESWQARAIRAYIMSRV